MAGGAAMASFTVSVAAFITLQDLKIDISRVDEKVENINVEVKKIEDNVENLVPVDLSLVDTKKGISYNKENNISVDEIKFGVSTKQEINDYYENTRNLPTGLLSSLHFKETSGDCRAVSHVGAKGCFQFMPNTKKYIEQRFDFVFDENSYKESSEAATIYLTYLYDKIDGYYSNLNYNVKWGLTLAAYNAGPKHALRWAKKSSENDVKTISELLNYINYGETRNYVRDITYVLFGLNHKIKDGETLYSISKEYDVSVNTLIASVGTTKIFPGQVIKIK